MARVPIEPGIAADVLFSSDRTCCVCREPWKRVQIHHIDDDHANSTRGNLAVLCLDCHDETQIRGGFARRLDSIQVMRYRDDWQDRIQRRRDDADRLAMAVMSGLPRKVKTSDTLQSLSPGRG
jgi:hypothetical protein